MKTGVIYARYSSDSQTEQSIEGQLRVCNEYAKNNDILILRTYIDRAMSGTNDNPPDFRQIKEDSKKHDFNVVLVYKFDRFSAINTKPRNTRKRVKTTALKSFPQPNIFPTAPRRLYSKV